MENLKELQMAVTFHLKKIICSNLLPLDYLESLKANSFCYLLAM